MTDSSETPATIDPATSLQVLFLASMCVLALVVAITALNGRGEVRVEPRCGDRDGVEHIDAEIEFASPDRC